MRPRQPPPRIWMMTDERQGGDLLEAVRRLPRGAGIVFRHYRLAAAERRALFDKVRAVARRRGLTLVLAGNPRIAAAWRADGTHGRHARGWGLRTVPVHDGRELAAAHRARADLIFVSPVFATRSHPEAASLGRIRALLLERCARIPAIALGGMTPHRARLLIESGFYGWAAIDALTRGPGQKRNAVPI